MLNAPRIQVVMMMHCIIDAVFSFTLSFIFFILFSFSLFYSVFSSSSLSSCSFFFLFFFHFLFLFFSYLYSSPLSSSFFLLGLLFLRLHLPQIQILPTLLLFAITLSSAERRPPLKQNRYATNRRTDRHSGL